MPNQPIVQLQTAFKRIIDHAFAWQLLDMLALLYKRKDCLPACNQSPLKYNQPLTTWTKKLMLPAPKSCLSSAVYKKKAQNDHNLIFGL